MMTKGFINKYWEKAFSLSCMIWAATLVFPSLQGTFYFFMVVSVIGIALGKLNFGFTNRSNILYLAYLSWLVISILWSSDIRQYFREFEKLIPQLLIGFLLFSTNTNQYINKERVLNSYIYGTLFAVLYLAVSTLIDVIWNTGIGEIASQGWANVDIISKLNHRTYIGIHFLLAISIIASRFTVINKANRLILMVIILLMFLLCVVSNSRILMLLSIIETIYLFIIFNKNNYIKWGTLIILLSFTVFMMNNDRLLSNLKSIKSISKVENVSRIDIWEASINSIENNKLIGNGLGGAKLELLRNYKEKGLNEAFKREYNTHNQYLQIMVFGGYVALILFFLFWLSLLFRIDVKSTTSVLFIVVFFISFFVESILIRNIGVFQFVFWLFIINLKPRIIINEKNSFARVFNSLSYIIITVILLTLIIILFTSKNISSPKTYVDDSFIILKNDSILNQTSLNSSMIYTSHKTIYENTKGNYAPLTYFSVKKEVADTVSFHSRIDVFVKDTTGLKRIALVCFDGKEHHYNYCDLNSRSWNTLELDGINFTSEITLFVQVLFRESPKFHTGEVYLTIPKLFINGAVVDDKIDFRKCVDLKGNQPLNNKVDF